MRNLSVFAGALAAAMMAAVSFAQAAIYIDIDKTNQTMSVSTDGGRSYFWPISSGRDGYDTPNGSYKAFRLERVYYSKKYDDAPMPNSVFFYGGYAIHGTMEESKLGRAASHGCVRLSRANAAVLFEMVHAQGLSNTHVTVRGSIPQNVPVASNRTREPRTTSSLGTRSQGTQLQARQSQGIQSFGAPSVGAANDGWTYGESAPRIRQREYIARGDEIVRPPRDVYVARPPREIYIAPRQREVYVAPPNARYDRGFDPYDARPRRRYSEQRYSDDGFTVYETRPRYRDEGFTVYERRGW